MLTGGALRVASAELLRGGWWWEEDGGCFEQEGGRRWELGWGVFCSLPDIPARPLVEALHEFARSIIPCSRPVSRHAQQPLSTWEGTLNLPGRGLGGWEVGGQRGSTCLVSAASCGSRRILSTPPGPGTRPCPSSRTADPPCPAWVERNLRISRSKRRVRSGGREDAVVIEGICGRESVGIPTAVPVGAPAGVRVGVHLLLFISPVLRIKYPNPWVSTSR